MIQLLHLNREDGKRLHPSGSINGTPVHQNMSVHTVHPAKMALHPEDLHEICHPFQSGQLPRRTRFLHQNCFYLKLPCLIPFSTLSYGENIRLMTEMTHQSILTSRARQKYAVQNFQVSTHYLFNALNALNVLNTLNALNVLNVLNVS